MLPEKKKKNVISALLSLVLYYNPYLLQLPAAISLPGFLLPGLLSGELFPTSAATEIPRHICIPVSSAPCSPRAARRLRALNLVWFFVFAFFFHSCPPVCTVQGNAQIVQSSQIMRAQSKAC